MLGEDVPSSTSRVAIQNPAVGREVGLRKPAAADIAAAEPPKDSLAKRKRDRTLLTDTKQAVKMACTELDPDIRYACSHNVECVFLFSYCVILFVSASPQRLY
jgi:hypothetical protein